MAHCCKGVTFSASRPGTSPHFAWWRSVPRSRCSGRSPLFPKERPERMNLFCAGVSHHTANVETRERYARRNDEALRQTTGCAEAILLSTCNRVEVYGVAEGLVENERLAQYLTCADFTDAREDLSAFYRY